MSEPTVLVVDPDADAREETVEALVDGAFAVEQAVSIGEASDGLEDVACVVTAYALPDGTAFDLLGTVREHNPDATCLIFADERPESMAMEDADGEVVDFVPKSAPKAREQLRDLVEHGIEERPQTAYPLPDRERDRLAVLEEYVDAAAEASGALERLTRLACALFDVPKAAVGLVHETEQRFVACHGVSLDTVPRENTVCTYAMLETDVSVVVDVREDPRFENNEALAETAIRFYASANLTAPSGHVVGTFCLYDEEPRDLSVSERDHLQLFANEAMDQLDLHRRLREGGEADD